MRRTLLAVAVVLTTGLSGCFIEKVDKYPHPVGTGVPTVGETGGAGAVEKGLPQYGRGRWHYPLARK